MSSKKIKIKYIDLCSGIGGFRIAIEQFLKGTKKNIEFECVLSADIKQDAIDTYNLNFNEKNVSTDINTLKPEDIKKFNLLCAGFPCQPFSSAGQKKGFKDNRGGMIFKIIDICKHHKPNVVLLENVYNLISLDKGKCITKIEDLFTNLGYKVSYKKLNSKDFGCPQSRERVYIVCHLKKLIKLDNIKINSTKTLLKNFIDTTDKKTDIDKKFASKLLKLHTKNKIYGCKIGDKRGGKSNIHSWDLEYNGTINSEEKKLMNQIMLERRKKHWATKKKIKWMDGMPLTLDDIKTFNSNKKLKEMLDNLVKKKYLRLEKCKDLINGKRVYVQSSKEGYNICKGKLSFPVSKILNPNDVAPTLTATDSHKLVVIINDKYIRRLNTKELKKICGFPDSFKISESVNKYDLFGNMATPPVILEILKLIY